MQGVQAGSLVLPRSALGAHGKFATLLSRINLVQPNSAAYVAIELKHPEAQVELQGEHTRHQHECGHQQTQT